MMRIAVGGLTTIAACLAATSARAADKPLYQPVPGWVKPAPAIEAAAVKDDAPIYLTLDQQERLQDGTVWSYHDIATRMASTEVVQQAGTVTLPWQPAKGDLVVHRLEIIRGAQHIDVLAGGKSFTVIRREQQLERYTIDGELTATMPVEGLQVGDVLHLSFTISRREEALGGAVQDVAIIAADPVRAGFARTRLVWPASSDVKWKSAADPEAVKVTTSGGERELVVAGVLPKAPDLPPDAPPRYQRLAIVEATSFPDWAAVSKVMAPFYATGGLIKPGGELAGEVAAIKTAQTDPLHRADAALELVQGKVRYLFNGLDKGNYVPQAPEQTWALKYGDCKAKTLLLLAVLRAMDIDAEPVLANLSYPDRIADRLPSAAAFNHVLVRAIIGGQVYWLDGTGTGTRFADIADVPPLRWVLPIRTGGSGLIAVPQKAPARPGLQIAVDLDQRAGVWFPTTAHIVFTMRGPIAQVVNLIRTQGSKEQKDEFVGKAAAGLFNTPFVISDYKLDYDPAAAEATVETDGITGTIWHKVNDRYEAVIDKTVSSIRFDPDRARPAWQAIPAATPGPATTIFNYRVLLPGAGTGYTLDGDQKLPGSLAGMTVERQVSLAGGVVALDEKAIENGVEIAPDAIDAARARVALAKTRLLTIQAPGTLEPRWAVVKAARATGRFKPIMDAYAAEIARDPDQAYGYDNRISFLIGAYDWKAALPDLNKVIALAPTADRYATRAYVDRVLGDDAKAVADNRAALKLDPASGGAISGLARYMVDHGQKEAALAMVQQRIEAGGDAKYGMMTLKADLMARAGDRDGAVAVMDQAVTAKPGNPSLLNQRCWIKGQLAVQLDTALKDCTKAIELSDYSAHILDSRALAYFRMNRLDDALGDLDAALAQDPSQAGSLYLRGIIRKRQGKTAEAVRDLDAATFMAPLIAEEYKPFGIAP